MSTLQSAHLTEEQIAECLLQSDPPAEFETHLAECQSCREEISGFMTSVDHFSRASLAWSESQPAVSLRARVRESSHPVFTVPLRWALAMAMLLVIALPLLRHKLTAKPDLQTVNLVEGDSEAQIAQDNVLMQSVDSALAADEASPLAEYDIVDQSQLHNPTRRTVRSR
ncbi:hypothetical protein [Granulicella aggregans]|jgi:hypothetical protein|uniref:hypothetical protein n=1 Tax=Granulicella aggregans TaxID=474949 RepID=UPI0021DFB155|nr:hypothetical protein [Granulicella aggregans]